jgi:hypothetical protein
MLDNIDNNQIINLKNKVYDENDRKILLRKFGIN